MSHDHGHIDEELARVLREHHEQHDGEAFRFCSCSCCMERGRQMTALIATLVAMFEGRMP
jgi:hypothetical protein